MKARRAPGNGAPDTPHNRSLSEGRRCIISRTTIRSQHDPSALFISVHPQRGAVRVAPSGELDFANAASLHAQLDELRGAGFEHVVLDLRELTFMDSSGVRLILREDRLARTAGRRFSLIPGIPAVQRVLSLCGLAAGLDFDDPFARAASRGVESPQGDFNRAHMGIAFQGYVAQLRRQGRPTSRLSLR
jgi:anti-sigma B factor antagonist